MFILSLFKHKMNYDILYNIFLWFPINEESVISMGGIPILNKDTLTLLNSKVFWYEKFKIDKIIMVDNVQDKKDWINQYIKVKQILQLFKNLLNIRKVNDHVQ